MLVNDTHLTELNSPNQTIKARVEFYKGSTLEKVCNCSDMLSEFTVEKTGEGKFFGFGICQKLRTVLFDIDRELNVTKEHTVEASFGVNNEFVYPFPNFYIDTVERDETSNQLNITAYDALYRATNHTVSELDLQAPYTIREFVMACASLLDIPLVIDEVASDSFDLYFEGGANYDGTENIRSAFNDIAEATQTIYYIDNHWDLLFKRIDTSGEPVVTVGKDQYFELANVGACVLSNITHTTELGDSVSSIVGEATENGVTQYIRDNPFWELREDIGTLLDNAQALVGGTSMHQFECTWMGNYLLEIGDKIALVTDDDSEIVSYVLDDTVVFDGALSQVLRWVYDDNSAETAENPTTLGAALNKTYARVDKVNKKIELVVSDTTANSEKISSLEITTDGIKGTVSEVQTEVDGLTTRVDTAETTITQNSEAIELRATKTEVEEVDGRVVSNTSNIAALQVDAEGIGAQVSSMETTMNNSIDSINGSLETLTKTVEAKMTSEQVSLAIKTELDNGVDKVTTSTGYTFDADGLTVSKSGSEMTTQITEDGMTVYRDNSAVLVANNQGVNAQNLHATTYLMVGGRSRFENYEDDRTGCFWIG